MRPIPIPPSPVCPAPGLSSTFASGSFYAEYIDDAGNRYACITDGAVREWYAIDDEVRTLDFSDFGASR